MLNEVKEQFPYENKRYYETKNFAPLLNYVIGEQIYEFPYSEIRERIQNRLFYQYDKFYKYYK